MKIGILTFHCAHNYGAVLQCYATQEFLRSKGHDVEVINYRPDYLLEPYKVFDIKRFSRKNPIHILKVVIKELILFMDRKRRFNGFERFINNRLQLGSQIPKDNIPSNYDAFVIGSDQIWNPRITQGFDSVYFADFPFEKGEKKYISYAASMEAKALNDEQIEYYRKVLSNFNAISVREKELQSILQPLIPQKISQVLDPSLLVSRQLWDSFSSDKTNADKYVVVYQVRNNANTLRIARHIAQQIGAKVRVLVAWLQFRPDEEVCQTATPEDFVNTIRNAACVVTTSFHGTAFSVIFNRPFYTIKLNDGADTRSISLLNSLGLEDRLIEINDTPKFSPVDYSLANQKLVQLRKESEDYLLNSLSI